MEDTIAPTPKKAAPRKTAKAPAKITKAAKTVKSAPTKAAKTVKKPVKTEKVTKSPVKKTAVTKKEAPVKKTLKAVPLPKEPKTAKAAKTDILSIILGSLDQDKGEDIVSIDLGGKSSIADYLVIATGRSTRHVSSMAEKLRDRLAKEGIKAKLEGQRTGDWVIVDAFDVIVHIFRPEVRSFYNLEKLWGADFSTMDYTLYK